MKNTGHTRYIFKKRRNSALFSMVDYAGSNIKKLLKPAVAPLGDEVHNILAVRLAHIGDTIFITPAIKCLKELYPDASITALVGSWSRQIIESNPYIDEIVTIDAPWHNRSSSRNLAETKRFLTTFLAMRKRKYDLAVQFGLDYRDNLICSLADSRYSIGYPVAGFGFVLSETAPFSPIPCHDIEHNLRLVESLGAGACSSATELHPSSDDDKYVKDFLDDSGLEDSAYALVHPGVGEINRQWTLEGFAGVVDGLYERHGITSVICGGPGDIDAAAEICEAASAPTIMAAGKTSLLQLASLASTARICVCLESSFAHISAAMRAPTVAIFSGFTDTERWKVAGDSALTIKKDLPCRNECDPVACPHRYCLTSITKDQILASIEYVMNKAGNAMEESECNSSNIHNESSVQVE